MNIPQKKVIKPFYNVRQANRMQACAKQLREEQNKFHREQEEKTGQLLEGMVASTFQRVKTKAVLRREANQAKRKAFNEALVSMVAVAAYNAMPVDSKEPINESAGLDEQPEAFQRMYDVASDMIIKDPHCSMVVGDKYARCSTLEIGASTRIEASQMAVAIAGAVSQVRDKLSDNPSQGSYVTQNYIDSLLSFGDTCHSEPKDRVSLVESVYEKFVGALTENVETKVVEALRAESDKAEMLDFLEESYQGDAYSKRSNGNLLRSAKAPSVFKEIFKTTSMQAMLEGFTQEQILAEAIARYSLLETLNSINLLGKTKEQIIDECISSRRKLSK